MGNIGPHGHGDAIFLGHDFGAIIAEAVIKRKRTTQPKTSAQ